MRPFLRLLTLASLEEEQEEEMRMCRLRRNWPSIWHAIEWQCALGLNFCQLGRHLIATVWQFNQAILQGRVSGWAACATLDRCCCSPVGRQQSSRHEALKLSPIWLHDFVHLQSVNWKVSNASTKVNYYVTSFILFCFAASQMYCKHKLAFNFGEFKSSKVQLKWQIDLAKRKVDAPGWPGQVSNPSLVGKFSSG